MIVNLQDFDFNLPPELIAQVPAPQRDQARLMVLDRTQQRITHDVFGNIGHYLQPYDMLVVNNTKVIPARLRGHKVATGGKVEVLLLHDKGAGKWDVLLKPAAKMPSGTRVAFGAGLLQGEVLYRQSDGTHTMQFAPADVHTVLDRCGEVPLPPYIKRPIDTNAAGLDTQRYQTVFAQVPGAVAAPTAGLHFTPDLLVGLQRQRIHQAALTLHVGWGTFRPIRTTAVEQHHMGREFYRLTDAEAQRIQQAQTMGGRVIAVGTTVTRTLETIMQETGKLEARSGWSELFIYPGYRFRVVEGLVTNFHLPRSTLFLLVSAFAGRTFVHEAYRQAIAERYRFYSYGDAMLIR